MVDVNVRGPTLKKLVNCRAGGIVAVAGPMLALWKAQQGAKAELVEAEAGADSLRLIADADAGTEARRALTVRVR